jgi:hypothetical protein
LDTKELNEFVKERMLTTKKIADIINDSQIVGLQSTINEFVKATSSYPNEALRDAIKASNIIKSVDVQPTFVDLQNVMKDFMQSYIEATKIDLSLYEMFNTVMVDENTVEEESLAFTSEPINESPNINIDVTVNQQAAQNNTFQVLSIVALILTVMTLPYENIATNFDHLIELLKQLSSLLDES